MQPKDRSAGKSGTQYDALLVVSFGGPEKREDVIPFLENTLRGRNVPRERMLEVSRHYDHFEGRSPINNHNRALVRALEAEFAARGPRLRVYWGNRNWHPFLSDAVRAMKTDGIRRALAFVTSAYSSYSSCRQYRENIEEARLETGAGAPVIDKLRAFYNHPRFIEAWTHQVRAALQEFALEKREAVHIVFTAHSIPLSMASNCTYAQQIQETCRLISENLGRPIGSLVYQSRSGSSSQPWLGPDIQDYLRQFASKGQDVLVAPIGFISDHMEILYDLDIEAKRLCNELGLKMIRASTPGNHHKFISMIRELVMERIEPNSQRRALGNLGPHPDVCPDDCCLAPAT